MGQMTGIEWTDATWNPVTGCDFTDVQIHPERMFREGVKLLRIARLFSPKRDWVQEMRGQIAIPVTSDK